MIDVLMQPSVGASSGKSKRKIRKNPRNRMPEGGTAEIAESAQKATVLVVAHDRVGRIAVVLTPTGAFLPGGGQQPEESPEAALARETREECGLFIRIIECLGVADEMLFAEEEGIYYRKRCTFFLAETVGETGTCGSEADHELLWLPRAEAILQLVHESQKWAVRLSVA